MNWVAISASKPRPAAVKKGRPSASPVSMSRGWPVGRTASARVTEPRIPRWRPKPLTEPPTDLASAPALADDAGVGSEGGRRVDRLFDRAIEAGLGDQYHPVVSRLLDGD